MTVCGREICLAEVADAVGEDCGALRGFALPEGDGGRGAVGVFDEDFAGQRTRRLDAPAGVAEEDDVAGPLESTAKCSSRVAMV